MFGEVVMGHEIKSEVGYSVGGTLGRPGIVTI